MAPSVSLSARVSPQVRARLAAEAEVRGMALATYAAQLLSGAAPEPSRAGEGAVQNEIECVFADMPPESGVYREICMALARTAEAGGSAGVTAGRELLSTVHAAERLFGPEPEDLFAGVDDEPSS